MKQLSDREVQHAGELHQTSLDEELTAGRDRPVAKMPYLLLDARYEKIRHAGSVLSCAVLAAGGI